MVDNGVDLRALPGAAAGGSAWSACLPGNANGYSLPRQPGSFGPNLDAVRLLLDRGISGGAAPRSRRRGCALSAAGRRRGCGDVRTQSANVEVHADVADVRPFLYRCGAMAVPLRIGGGSRLKILEALACSLPVVASTVGAEGLHLLPGVHFARADQTADMAQSLDRVDAQSGAGAGDGARPAALSWRPATTGACWPEKWSGRGKSWPTAVIPRSRTRRALIA